MRRLAVAAALAASLMVGMAMHGRAALDESTPAVAADVELLVLEVSDCFACDLVRKHIQPVWARAPQARQVPLRYIDLNVVDEASLGLVAPVSIVPTIVLRREGAEVSRIAGYPGPASFVEAVEYMLAQAD